MDQVRHGMVRLEPVRDSNRLLGAADNAVPPVGGKKEAVSVLDPNLVHLGIREVRELVELRLCEVDRAVVVWILICVTLLAATRIYQSALE